ncbi:hypothetical protein M271_50705 [Streptomyces rapamycinicus NRRL 5491]|nr:hypothetical protein M271_50705 [Streptomyces rapamycinicus NRRL 5491]
MAARATMSRMSGVVAVAVASSMSAWARAWRTPPVCRATRMAIVGVAEDLVVLLRVPEQ